MKAAEQVESDIEVLLDKILGRIQGLTNEEMANTLATRTVIAWCGALKFLADTLFQEESEKEKMLEGTCKMLRERDN